MIPGKDYAKVAKMTNLTIDQVTEVLDATAKFVDEKVKSEEKYTLPGFGTFHQVKKEARIGRNPKTGASVEIPAKTTINFKIAGPLKKFLVGRI